MASSYYTVEWYRPRHLKAIARVTLPCAGIVLAASLCLGAGVISSDPVAGSVWVTVGVILAIAGPTLAALGLRRVLSVDVYLELRSDGLLFKRGDQQRFVSWQELEAARGDNSAARVELEVEQGPPLVLDEEFIGIDSVGLGERIMELRNKALMNVLRKPVAAAHGPLS